MRFLNNYPFLRIQPKNSSHFVVDRMFISVSTTAVHQCLSQARYIHSKSLNFMSLKHILTLQSQLRPDLPRSLFRPGFSTKILHACLFSRMRTTYSYVANLFPPHLIARKESGVECKSRNCLTCSFVQCPRTYSLLGPYISLKTLFTNTLYVLPLT